MKRRIKVLPSNLLSTNNPINPTNSSNPINPINPSNPSNPMNPSNPSNLQIFDPTKYAGWDDLLIATPGYSFFHSSAWAKVLKDSYGYTPLYFAAIENGQFSALVPVMEVNSFLTGKRGVSLPFTDYCEPIINGRIEFVELFNNIIAYGKKRGWKYLELRGGEKFLSPQSSVPFLSPQSSVLVLLPALRHALCAVRFFLRKNTSATLSTLLRVKRKYSLTFGTAQGATLRKLKKKALKLRY